MWQAHTVKDAARLRVKTGRAVRVRAFNVVCIYDPTKPSRRRVKNGKKKMIIRIRVR
jgi:hypothetical protein